MTELLAWPPRDDEELGQALSDLARKVAFPETPPIAPAVASRLRGQPMRWWIPRTLRRSIGLALLALLILAGVAVAFGLAIGGLRITLAPGTQPPLPSGVIQSRAFGTDVGLAEARRRAGFSLLVPTLAAIGQPDHAYLNPNPAGGTVFLVWASRPGYSADADGLGVVVSEFRATVDPGLWEKIVHEDSTIIRTQVGDQPAFWISGGEHTFFYRDANGLIVDSSLRLVGTALIWEEHGLVLRVEGAPDLAAAKAVAESLR